MFFPKGLLAFSRRLSVLLDLFHLLHCAVFVAGTVFCSFCAVSTALGQDVDWFLDPISESPKS